MALSEASVCAVENVLTSFRLPRALTVYSSSFVVFLFGIETVFLCSPGWPAAHRDPPASASAVLGLTVCATTTTRLPAIPSEAGVGSIAGQLRGSRSEALCLW